MGCLFITVIIPVINEFLALLSQSLDWVRTKIAIATARDMAKAQEENLDLGLDDEDEDEEKIPFGFHAEPVEQEPAIGTEVPSEEEYEDDDDWCDDRGGRKKK